MFHCKSEHRCNPSTFIQENTLRSLDLGVVSVIIRMGLGLKKSLCLSFG